MEFGAQIWSVFQIFAKKKFFREYHCMLPVELINTTTDCYHQNLFIVILNNIFVMLVLQVQKELEAQIWTEFRTNNLFQLARGGNCMLPIESMK